MPLPAQPQYHSCCRQMPLYRRDLLFLQNTPPACGVRPPWNCLSRHIRAMSARKHRQFQGRKFPFHLLHLFTAADKRQCPDRHREHLPRILELPPAASPEADIISRNDLRMDIVIFIPTVMPIPKPFSSQKLSTRRRSSGSKMCSNSSLSPTVIFVPFICTIASGRTMSRYDVL